MVTKNEFILRASGAIGLGLPIFFIAFGIGMCWIGFSEKNAVGIFLGLPAVICGIWYYGAYYIKITDKEFIVKSMVGRNESLTEKTKIRRVPLDEIASVTIGRVKYFREHPELLNQDTQGMIGSLEARTGYLGESFSARIATPYTPIMGVWHKNGRCTTVTTKPFSKNGFRKLIGEFQRRGIKVVTDPALKL